MGIRKLHLFLPFLITSLLAGAWFTGAHAEPGEVVQGRCLLMFKTKVAEKIDDFLEGRASLTQVTGDKGLEKVWKDFGVIEMSRLFPDVDRAIKDRGNRTVREAYNAFQKRIRDRFPLRTARAPEGMAHIDTFGIFVLRFNPVDPPAVVCRALEKTGHLVYAEPDQVIRIKLTVNDPLFGNLWGITKIGCPTAWNTARGTGTVVAVIDTGIDNGHQDLQNQIWSNPGETPANSTDDDANGFVDDTWGWDFINTDNNPMDDHNPTYHGTHCAGTVAAEGNNNIGVVGVAFGAKLMALKGLDGSGAGTNAAMTNCMNYAINNGADVMSCSWGGTGYSATYATTIANAVSSGVVPVFAMGNDNRNGTLHGPSNSPQAFAVAASTQKDGRASFSNYGIKVDVTAPGVAIHSTMVGGYQNLSGTSMATPHVAGAAAVLISDLNARSVTASVEQVRTILRKCASDQEAPGWDCREGHGRLNVSSMMGVNPGLYCEAKITGPNASGPELGNSIQIDGYAAGPRFQSYTLEYAPGIPYDSVSWTNLTTSSTAVQNGTLYTWDVSSLADGRYTIRLTVQNDQNTTFTDRTDFVRDTYSDDAHTSAVEVFGNPLTFHSTADRNHTSRNADWFKMECVAGVDYEFRTDNLSGDMDTVLELYRTDGTTRITSNDDYPRRGDQESRIAWTCSTSGTYYINVNGYYKGNKPSQPGSFRVHFLGLFKDGQESDNTSATAKSIPAGGYASHHSIVPAGDIDWMSVSLQSGRTYTFEVTKASTSGTMGLDLYSTDGSTLITSGAAGADNRIRIASWTCPTTGTYYLRASAGAGAAGHYHTRVWEKQDILLNETFQVVADSLWTATGGSWTVTSGEYLDQNNADSPHYSNGGITTWNHVVLDGKIRFQNPTATGTANSGLILRYINDDNLVVARIREDNKTEILQYENGTAVFLAQVNRNFSVGTTYPVRVTFEGTTLTFDINGTVVHAACSPRFTAGKIALRSYGSQGVFDDLKLWRPGPGTLVDLVLNVPTLLDGMDGVAYATQFLTATGGTTPYTFAFIGGTLPPGMTVASNGAISGTPTAGGAFVFHVSVVDSAGRLRTGVANLFIATAPASITVPVNSATGNYTVSWTGVTGAISYTLEEDLNASFTAPTVVYSGANTSFNVTGKSAGIYYYRVRAVNVAGNSAWTVGANGCTVGMAPPPLPPATITVPLSSATGNYTVSWAISATATSYDLEEDTVASFPSPTTVYTGVNTSFNVTGKPNGTYYYRVRASNVGGNSGWTAGGNGCTVFLPPPAPASITVPLSSATGNYTVSWAASATATSYTLEEDTSAAFPAPTPVYTGANLSFNVTGKPTGTYYYRVQAVNAAGNSAWTAGANGCAVGLAPPAPASITVPLSSATGNYMLSWASSALATSYDLEEDIVATFTNPTTVYSGANTSFNATGMANGTYYYRVRASNASGNSGWTLGANGCTVSLPPPAPASITVPLSSSTGNYTVSWVASATATSYTLEEDTSSAFAAPTPVYSGANLSFNVTGKSAGTYYYRVRALNSAGNSAWTIGGNGCVVNITTNMQAQSISVVAAPVTVYPGDSFEVMRTIQNSGGVAGTASYSILLSDDTTLTVSDTTALSDTTPSIAPGSSDTATVTCVVPAGMVPGDYYVGLYIDSGNNICTIDPDVSVIPFPPPPPPPSGSDDGSGCGCSPVSGVATPADIFGMILPFILWGLAIISLRRRRS